MGGDRGEAREGDRYAARLLADDGGPNLAGNYVDSMMWAFNSTAFVQNPSFFYMTHFSRAIPPGSVAVDADVVCQADHPAYCQFVAFLTPNEDLVVILTNDEVTMTLFPKVFLPRLARGQGEAMGYTITCGETVVEATLPWQSIQTVIMPCAKTTPTMTPTVSEAPSSSPTQSAGVVAILGIYVVGCLHVALIVTFVW